MFTRESISLELKRIQDSIPKLLKDNTLKEVPKTPIMELVFKKALEDADITPEKKAQLQKLIDTGILSQNKIIENPKVAKMRDDWVAKEIKKSVREGRLPSKKKLKELKFNELHEK